MGVALLVCRLVLAGVFVLAGWAKLADLAGSRRAVVDFGIPERLAAAIGVVLPIAEIGVAVGLMPVASARFGALGAVFLLVCFSLGIANAVAHGRSPDCHCFGQVHSAPASWRTLARNLVLLGMAGFVAIAGWDNAGISATHWVTQVSSAWLVAIVAGVMILVLVLFQVWFSLQLLSQNGRSLARLEALEAKLSELNGALGLPDTQDPELGHGLSGGGLPVGVPAPGFEFEGLDGKSHSLEALLSAGPPVMLVFSAAGCGPCDALMPELAAWQRRHARLLTIAVIAGGEPESIRAKSAEHGLELVLLEPEREVAQAYGAHGTPMAVVIDNNGLIASPTVGGSDAIGTLVGQATRRAALDVLHVPSSNGHRNGGAPAPDVSRVGEPAPELVLLDLEGEPVALKDLYGDRTVAIFWNPGCGFCQRMLPELRAFEEQAPAGSPRLAVISAGDAETVRQHGLRSTVLLDSEAKAMAAFGAGGTPMGVLVGEGRIASHVAAGADAVFQLIRTATVSPARNGNGR